MKRTSMLKILNPILGIVVATQILTGIFHKAISHEAFEVLHGTGGYAVGVAAILHVILNWNWIKANMLKRGPALES